MRTDVGRVSGGALVAPLARLIGGRGRADDQLDESEVAARLYGRRFSSAGGRSPIERSPDAPSGGAPDQ